MPRKLYCIIALAGLMACNGNLIYSEYRPTAGGTWKRAEVMDFSFIDPDTVARHNIFIHIRNDNNFPYSNLFLIATLNFPDGTTVQDTLEYEMATLEGKWMGKGFGSIRENKLWYKENIIFPSKGVYTFELTHAMRKNGDVQGVENLPGITDVGMEIEKSE